MKGSVALGSFKKNAFIRTAFACAMLCVVFGFSAPAARASGPITPSTIPNGTTTVAYSQTLSVGSGSGPFVWSISSGSLPAGLSLNTSSSVSTSTISGTPTATGTVSFTVRAVDGAGATSTQAYTVTIASPDLATGLTGWWKFDDGSGSSTIDSSGNGNAGALNGSAVSWIPGYIGTGALSFSGGTVTDASYPMSALSSGITISEWIYPTKVALYTAQGIFEGSNLLLTVGYNSSSAGTLNWGGMQAGLGANNAWYHVVATADATGYRLYVNGALAASSSTAYTPPSGSGFTLGTWDYGTSFGGYMDNVRLYGRALSPTDVSSLYVYDLSLRVLPPAISFGAPNGTISLGTGTTSIAVETNAPATCKYSTSAGTAYASMSNTFSVTGGTQHLSLITGLQPSTSYTYYVRCIDTNNDANTSDYTISFNTPAAPSDTDIIPLSRRVDWTKNPAVNFSIPAWSNGRNAKTNDGALGDGANDDTAAIQSCVSNTAAGTYCYLPAGTYRVTGTITIPGGKGIKGAGADASVIIADQNMVGDILGGGGSAPSNAVNVSSGAAKGSTRIFGFGGFSGYSVGGLALINQDNVGLTAETSQGSWQPRSFGQIDRIAAVGNGYLDLETPLDTDFDYSANVRTQYIAPANNIGIENLGLNRSQPPGYNWQDHTTSKDGNNISLSQCANCWVANVHSQNVWNRHAYFTADYGSIVRDSWFDQTWQVDCGGNACYGMDFNQTSSGNLAENNICHVLRHCMILEIGGTGNIFGYNYSNDSINENGLATDYLMADMIIHGGDPFMNLYEGNTAEMISTDNSNGASHDNTFFRNNLTGAGLPPVYVALFPIDDWVSNLYENFVGNILGSAAASGTCSTCNNGGPGPLYPGHFNDISSYSWNAPTGHGGGLFRLGTLGDVTGGTTAWGVALPDPRVPATMINHGNYDPIAQTTIWDSTIANHSLINSYYLSGKPSWWDSSPWPGIGSDISGVYNNNPAESRYLAAQAGNTAPTVTTSAPASISASAITLNASISFNGGSPIAQSGFALSTDPNLVSGVSTTTLGSQSDIGSFSQAFSGLAQGTTYYFRAYAVNSTGTSTGAISSATTLSVSSGGSTPPASGGSSGGGGGGGGGSGSSYTPVASTSLAVAPVPGCPKGLVCTPIAPAATDAPACGDAATFGRSLAFGSRGSDVASLQALLIQKGYLASNLGTGFFGSLTQSALAAYQRAAGIAPAQGYFGPITMRHILASTAGSCASAVSVNASGQTPVATTPIGASSTRTTAAPAGISSAFVRNLALGSIGPDVRALQTFLNARGFLIAASGNGSPGNESSYFGLKTQQALARFQAANHIAPATGYFGPITRKIVDG